MIIQVKIDNHLLKTIDLPCERFDIKTRIKRSIKFFIIFFILALFSVLMPILHFFLVPGFLIAAIVLSYWRFNQSSFMDISSFKCPKCSESFLEKEVYQTEAENFTMLNCSYCNALIKLEI